MNALALALQFSAWLAYFNRNSTQVERVASDLIELSTRYTFSYWLEILSKVVYRREAHPKFKVTI